MAETPLKITYRWVVALLFVVLCTDGWPRLLGGGALVICLGLDLLPDLLRIVHRQSIRDER